MPRPNSRLLKQTAVYWAPGDADVNGNTTWVAGVEIKVRWQNGVETVLNADGENDTSKAIVYSDGEQDIKQDARMFLGQKADLTAAQIPDPDLVPEAFRVIVSGTSPDVRNRRSLNKSWLK